MTKRIFSSICRVSLLIFTATVLLIMSVLYAYFTNVLKNQLKIQTELASQGVTKNGAVFFEGLDARNFRITWIDSDGNVLYDNESNYNQMENHLQREEIQQALKKGYGESERYSSTLMERSLYAAKRLDNGTVLRLSVAQRTIFTLILGMLQPLIIIFIITILLSVILATGISKKIVKPLNELNLDEPLSNDRYEELSPLLRRIDSQQAQLRSQTAELQRKQNELTAVTQNMKEGLILLNADCRILSINPAAMFLLDTDARCIGQDILTISRNLKLQEILTPALNGTQTEKTVSLNDGCYQIDASPVTADSKVFGIALLIFDITEKAKAEQLRREFTANVSHELKTPLHSISGYAELLKNNMVKRQDVAPFSEKIYTEAQRMIQLVEDIINLSHLDEGANDMKPEKTDLYIIAETVVQSLEQKAKDANVTLALSGTTSYLVGIPELLQEIVFNLCDNAIKYNKKNGSVDIRITSEPSSVLLTVSDTGIGIPAEHKEYIFERFYRVDKSHSKEVGGTGLGLSIVKHAAKIHEAKIDLQSTPDMGTTITVRFPRSEPLNSASLSAAPEPTGS